MNKNEDAFDRLFNIKCNVTTNKIEQTKCVLQNHTPLCMEWNGGVTLKVP
jgi:hypothetical protein